MKYDYAIIGAGVSGLSSAIILAKSGYRVALIEKSTHTSPLLRGFLRKGVQFDTGFHYTGGLGEGEPLDIIFRYLGLSDNLTSFPFCEQGFDIFRSIREGFEFRFPSGYALIRERLVSEFPGEKGAIDKYLDLVKKTCDSMPYLNLEVDFNSSGIFRMLSETTLKETLDSLTENSMLKALLSMHCVLYGVPPGEVPFSLHACIVGNYYLSARGLRGGGLSLAKAFDTRVRDLGVDVYCSSEVAGIILSSQGEITGVRLGNNSELTCNGCISTVHPALLLDMLPEESFRPAYRNRLRELKETVSALMLFAISDTSIPLLAGSNLFVFPDADCINRLGGRRLEDNLMYLTAAYKDSCIDPAGIIGISPASFEITAAWQDSVTGNRPDDYRAFKDDIITRFRSQIERNCPELTGSFQYTEGATPLTVRDYNNTPLGGLYGVKHMVGQHNPLPVSKIKGLFLAGQAIISPGIMGAVLSALIACGNILGHDRLNKDLKACR